MAALQQRVAEDTLLPCTGCRNGRRQFEILFKEYPELVMDSYEHELKGRPWKEYCAICRSYEELAESKRGEIVARFKQLVKIK